MQALALAIVLRVELRGWSEPAPHLPKPPLRDESGPEGRRLLIYELTPADAGLSVEDAALRIGSRLRRLFGPQASPFSATRHAARLVLEFGVLADPRHERFSYGWPLEFLDALVECDIELNVSHYLPQPDKADAEDE